MNIKDDLRRDEGLRLYPYKDSVGKWSIGYGRNLSDNGITPEEAEILLAHDVYAAEKGLDAALPWWKELDSLRRRALLNMAFNMGIPKLLGFVKMLDALKRRDFETAAKEALDSKWAGQVGSRAERIADLFLGKMGG